jgi:mRNA interferase MazF
MWSNWEIHRSEQEFVASRKKEILILKTHPYPTRVPVAFEGKDGWIVLDQIRTVDRRQLAKKLGAVPPMVIRDIKAVLREILVD